jgi:hypothetical protein
MLAKLAMNTPPEEMGNVVARLAKLLPKAFVDDAKVTALAPEARKDTPEGFRAFFWCVYAKNLPEHAYYGFIVPAYWAHGKLERKLEEYYNEPGAAKFRYIYEAIRNVKIPKRGIIIRAAREFAKTIVLTTAFNAFRIGQKPHGMNLLVQVSGDSSKDNSGKVAEIIQKSPGFAKVFPHVKPDTEKGWGAGGYYVKRDDISADEWTKICSDRNSPSLLGVGYKSSEVIGKHPDGMALIDDIHDNDNTSSDRELRNTLAKIRSDFIYAPTRDAWLVFVGTPWVSGDALDVFAKSGEFVVVDIPAYMEVDEDANMTMPNSEWFEEREYVYLWPGERGADWVRLKKNTSTPAEFARMVQLNVDRALVKEFKYQSFPSGDIKWQEWPVNFGVDPVATVSAMSGREGGSSHFACAFALRTPYNNVVIGDGILKKCDQPEAEQLLTEAARRFKTFRGAAIEMDGAGILFAAMQKATGMTIRPYGTAEIRKMLGLKSSRKMDRQYEFLVRLFSYGAVVISDADTPYLNTVRSWLDRFPNFSDTAPEWDVGDSILMAVYDIPEVWTTVIANVDRQRESIFSRQPKQKSAFSGALGGFS